MITPISYLRIDLNIDEIAARTGFSSPAHLSHAFKSAFGHSPRAYRLTTKASLSR